MARSAVPATADDGPTPDALEVLAPPAAAAFRRLCQLVPAPAHQVAAVRRACAGALGLAGLPPPDEEAPVAGPATAPAAASSKLGGAGDGTGTDLAILDFAERFSIDVATIDDGHRARFTDVCGDDAFGLVQAIYVADFAPRVVAVLDALLDPVLEGGGVRWPTGAPLVVDAAVAWVEVEGFLREVHRLDRLDPVLSELVRLRGARSHRCRLCSSLRSRPALAAGATEELFDALDDEGSPMLSDRARTALQVVDALLWHPARVPDDLVDEVRRSFTPAEAVELVLDVMRNAANKIAVALAADAPNVTEGIEVYEVDADGIAHYGLAAP